MCAKGGRMTDLEIIQMVFGKNEVSEKWLINMLTVCKLVRKEYREALDKMNEQAERVPTEEE